MDRRLLVLALGMFALGTDSFVVAGVLPQIARSFDVPIGTAGQLVSVYAVTLAVLAPTIAALAASVQRKRLLLAGLGLFVVANLGTAIAPTFGVALATRALAGVGAAMFSPTAVGAAAMLVPPERRGFALSVVLAGMTLSTAVGAPIGAIIGGLGSWYWTMVFVSALAFGSALGVLALLSTMPLPPAVSLRQRLRPIADAPVALTLLTTLLFMSGVFTVYTYFSVVFARAIAGDAVTLGVLLVGWGAAGTVSNLTSGRLVDRIGPRKVLITMLSVVMVDLLFVRWTGATLWSAAPAILIWGGFGWGQSVPQQYRLVSIAPGIAPLILGLNNTAVYLGMAVGGVLGAATLEIFGAAQLGYVAACLVGGALIAAELASRRIEATEKHTRSKSLGFDEQQSGRVHQRAAEKRVVPGFSSK